MGLKDMFRSGGSKTQKSGSPRTSAKGSRAGSSPRDSRGNSLDRNAADAISLCSSSHSHLQQNEDTRAHEDALKIEALERELSKSRLEAMKMHEQIADLEAKVADGDLAWQTFPSEEQAQHEEEQHKAQQALEERNRQLREKVRDLQEEVERLREGRSSLSSCRADENDDDDQSQRSVGSLPSSAYTPHEIEAMVVRIKELEDLLEEKNSQSAGSRADGMEARIMSLEAMLEANKEETEELHKERDQLRDALQDADDRLEAVEAAGAASSMQSISRLRDVENQLADAQEQLRKADMSTKIAQHAYEELRTRVESETLARRKSHGKERSLQEEFFEGAQRSGKPQRGKAPDSLEENSADQHCQSSATSADTGSDFEEDSEVDGGHVNKSPVQAARSSHSHRSIVPKESNFVEARQAVGGSPTGKTPAHLLKEMFEESDDSIESWPKAGHGGSRSHRAPPRETLDVQILDRGREGPEPPSAEKDAGTSMKESPGTMSDADVHMRALDAERAKTKLLEVKIEAYEQRLRDLETSFHRGDLFSTHGKSYRHSPGGPSILERTDKWVNRRKNSRTEPEQRTREQMEEEIFQQKVEMAKAKLSTTKCGVKSPRAPDLGKAYAWEKPSATPRRKGASLEQHASPSQKKHYAAIYKSSVTQNDAGIAGPQPTARDDEKLRGPRTSRDWNPTQMQGSKYGFTPTVEEKEPPRVNLIAPDKVTGSDKAPWLVECHPEYNRSETLNNGTGRSKKHFPGKGFQEGVQWPEDKQLEVMTYQQRQDTHETRGHYLGKPKFVSDAAGCPSAIPSSSNVKVFRQQYGDLAGKGEWYDSGSRGLKTSYPDHVALKTNNDTRKGGKPVSEAKVAQLFGPSPFGLDSQTQVPARENWDVICAPAPFGRDDQIDARRKPWA